MMNEVLHIDCLIGMESIPDKSIDMILTSPPYDNLRTYNSSLEWTFEIFQNIAKKLFRVIKEGGVCVWVVGDATINGSESGTSFKQALYFKEIGFNLHDTMIYNKDGMPNAGSRYQQVFEYMFVFSKGKPKTINIITDQPAKDYRPNGKRSVFRSGDLQVHRKVKLNPLVPRKNIWKYATGLYGSTKDKIAFQHPAIFPELLAQDHIMSWSNEDDLILDPFAGSGTTAIACINTNRNYILMEKEEKYYNIILNRIKKHTVQLKLIA